MSTQIRDEWMALSAEQKSEVSQDRVVALTELREEKANTPFKSTLSVFHDAANNINAIIKEVRPPFMF